MDSPKSFRELEQVHSRIHSKTAYYSYHIKEILLKPVSSTVHFLKNYGKEMIIGGAMLYMFSPEIGYFKNKGERVPADEKTKKEFGIDSVYQTNDRETNTIPRLMTGLLDRKDLDSLIALYGHKQAFEALFNCAVQDTLLYKCYCDLLISLHNPHSTFGGDYKRDFLGNALGYDNSYVGAKVEELASRKHILNIVTTGVFADTQHLKSRLEVENSSETNVVPKQELADVLQQLNEGKMVRVDSSNYIGGVQKVFNSEMAENGHIYILHKEGLIRNYLNYAGNYIKNGFSQKALYDRKFTIENMTHEEEKARAKGEEGILIAKLIKSYEEKMPKDSKWHIERLISFFDGYFLNYRDKNKADLYREKLKQMH